MAVVPIVVPVIFTLVIIIGFVGNLLVVLVVILNKKMRNTTNILIFNLAVMLQHASTCFKLGFNAEICDIGHRNIELYLSLRIYLELSQNILILLIPE